MKTLPFGRETLHVAGKRFPDFGKRLLISETLKTLRPIWLFPIFPKIYASRELSRNSGAFADLAGRHFHLAGERFADFGKLVPISGNSAYFPTNVVISDIPTNLSF